MFKNKNGTIMVIVLLNAIYALNIIDYLQTVHAIRFFGLGVEANPIGRLLFEHNCAWIAKFIGVPILLIILAFIIKFDIRQVWAPCVLFVFYCILTLRNFVMLKRMGILLNCEVKPMMTITITLAVCSAILAMACGSLLAHCKYLKKK